jgi:hypothetical protein
MRIFETYGSVRKQPGNRQSGSGAFPFPPHHGVVSPRRGSGDPAKPLFYPGRGNKKNLRDAAEQTLRDRLSGLISELGQKLDDTDPLWLAFGLNEPGATNLPDSADGLVLTAGAAGTVLAHWSNASRATRYRVFKQIDGVDPVPVNIATVTDSDATLTGQPSGKMAKIYVIAANDAGQAAPSETVQIVAP